MSDRQTTDLLTRLTLLESGARWQDASAADTIEAARDEIARLRAERRILRGAMRDLIKWGAEVPAPRDTDHRERGYMAFDKAKRALRGKR